VTLDLTTPEGRDLFKRLVADAHGVIDNYAADVLPRLGLDYETLSQINPSLVMVSMPPFASKGTWSDCRGYGTTLEQASGLPNISGEEGGPPAMSQYAHADPYGGYNATAAMLLGLLHRQRTGEGQFVEMAHVGGMLALAAPGIIEQSATGRVGPRLGNRHAMFVPHGAFPAEGQDKWVVVAVTTNEEWRALCGVIGRPDLAGVTDRRAREAEVEAAVTEWTRARSPEDAMRQLQAAGVPAGAVLNSLEVLSDANLAARGFWQTLPREYVGTVTVASAPFREDDQAYVVTTPAPTVGQHNAEVLVGELGLTAAQMADLEARRVIGHELIEPAPAA
jgi:crotonobetainyl-CoA:carnitine CoA-transferase CaiB-like acyl-CoA transferase